MVLLNPAGQLVMRMDVIAHHTPSEDFYVDYYRTSQVTTCSVLDAATFCNRLQREAKMPYVVHRTYDWKPAPPSNTDNVEAIEARGRAVYQSARNLRSQVGNHSVHLMVNCEEGGSPARFLMYSAMIKEAMKDLEGPVGMVFGNVAVANMRSGFHGEPNDWSHPWIMGFMRTMDQYRHVRLPSGSYAFILGVHNYIALYPWISVNGGQHRIHSWTEGDKFLDGRAHINWAEAQDHLAREHQGQRLALGWSWDDDKRQWIPGENAERREDGTYVEPSWYMVTEQLIDAVNDVKWIHRADMSFEGKYHEPAGYHSLARTWERPDWFPGASVGATLAKFTRWNWIVVHGPTGYCVGSQDFASGDTGGWDSHNLAEGGTPDVDYYTNLGAFRAELPEHFFRDVPANPAPIPEPKPDDGKPKAPFMAIVDAKNDYANVRKGAGTNFPIIGVIKKGQPVIRFKDYSFVTGLDDNSWSYVKLNGVDAGWVRSDLITSRVFKEEILKEYL